MLPGRRRASADLLLPEAEAASLLINTWGAGEPQFLLNDFFVRIEIIGGFLSPWEGVS